MSLADEHLDDCAPVEVFESFAETFARAALNVVDVAEVRIATNQPSVRA